MNPKNKKVTRKHPPLLLLTGASGAGKSSVLDVLLQDKTLPIVRFITCTTRPKRPGERHGKDYWFLTRPDFEAKMKKQRFYESAEVYGNYYGSSKDEMKRLLKGKKTILMILDVQGARTMKDHHPEATAIFIDAPTASLKHRLVERGSDMNDMKRRLAEITKEKRFKPEADEVILNRDGDLKRTVSRVRTIIKTALRNT
ncbi:MAG: guanylate kinase [Patescibacteria group bacterium]|jgi:guanylate kinase